MEQLVSVTLVNGELHVVKRIPSAVILTCYPPRRAPDALVKEIYSVDSLLGEIVLSEVINGYVEPEVTIPEKFVFEE